MGTPWVHIEAWARLRSEWQKQKVECFINRRSDFGTPLARVPVQMLVLSQPEQLYVQCILCTNISTVTFILLPDHVLGLLGDFILHLVHLKVSPTYQPNNLLKGVGARDVHAHKKQCLV